MKITKEEYLAALKVVELYDSENGLLAKDWAVLHKNELSTRLFNGLRREGDYASIAKTNIKEIQKNDLTMIRNLSDKSWEEFIKVRGF